MRRMHEAPGVVPMRGMQTRTKVKGSALPLPAGSYVCTARPVTILGMSHGGNGRSTSVAVSITMLIAGTLVTLAMIGGVILLALDGHDATFIAGIVAPTVAAAGSVLVALGKLVSLERKQDKQTETLDEQTETLQQIEHQTNGALRDHVTKAVERAFNNRFGPPDPNGGPK